MAEEGGGSDLGLATLELSVDTEKALAGLNAFQEDAATRGGEAGAAWAREFRRAAEAALGRGLDDIPPTGGGGGGPRRPSSPGPVPRGGTTVIAEGPRLRGITQEKRIANELGEQTGILDQIRDLTARPSSSQVVEDRRSGDFIQRPRSANASGAPGTLRADPIIRAQNRKLIAAIEEVGAARAELQTVKRSRPRTEEKKQLKAERLQELDVSTAALERRLEAFAASLPTPERRAQQQAFARERAAQVTSANRAQRLEREAATPVAVDRAPAQTPSIQRPVRAVGGGEPPNFGPFNAALRAATGLLESFIAACREAAAVLRTIRAPQGAVGEPGAAPARRSRRGIVLPDEEGAKPRPPQRFDGGAREATNARLSSQRRRAPLADRIDDLEARGANVSRLRGRLGELTTAQSEGKFGTFGQLEQQLKREITLLERKQRLLDQSARQEQAQVTRGARLGGPSERIDARATAKERSARLADRIEDLDRRGAAVGPLRTQLGSLRDAQSKGQFGTFEQEERVLRRQITLLERRQRLIDEAARAEQLGLSRSARLGGPREPVRGRADLPGSPAFIEARRREQGTALTLAARQGGARSSLGQFETLSNRQVRQADQIQQLAQRRVDVSGLERRNEQLLAALGEGRLGTARRLSGEIDNQIRKKRQLQQLESGERRQAERNAPRSPIRGTATTEGSPLFLAAQERRAEQQRQSEQRNAPRSPIGGTRTLEGSPAALTAAAQRQSQARAARESIDRQQFALSRGIADQEDRGLDVNQQKVTLQRAQTALQQGELETARQLTEEARRQTALTADDAKRGVRQQTQAKRTQTEARQFEGLRATDQRLTGQANRLDAQGVDITRLVRERLVPFRQALESGDLGLAKKLEAEAKTGLASLTTQLQQFQRTGVLPNAPTQRQAPPAPTPQIALRPPTAVQQGLQSELFSARQRRAQFETQLKALPDTGAEKEALRLQNAIVVAKKEEIALEARLEQIQQRRIRAARAAGGRGGGGGGAPPPGGGPPDDPTGPRRQGGALPLELRPKPRPTLGQRVGQTLGGQRAQGALSSALIGGGFPLLFGQGVGASAGGLVGGALGGAAGGGFGFGVSIVGTIIGSAVDQLIARFGQLATALQDPIAAFDQLIEQSVLASKAQETYVQSLIAAGRTVEAAQVIRKEAGRTIDPGAAGLLADAQDRYNRTISDAQDILGSFVAGPAAEFLNFISDLVRRAGLIPAEGGQQLTGPRAFINARQKQQSGTALGVGGAALAATGLGLLATPAAPFGLPLAAVGLGLGGVGALQAISGGREEQVALDSNVKREQQQLVALTQQQLENEKEINKARADGKGFLVDNLQVVQKLLGVEENRRRALLQNAIAFAGGTITPSESQNNINDINARAEVDFGAILSQQKAIRAEAERELEVTNAIVGLTGRRLQDAQSLLAIQRAARERDAANQSLRVAQVEADRDPSEGNLRNVEALKEAQAAAEARYTNVYLQETEKRRQAAEAEYRRQFELGQQIASQRERSILQSRSDINGTFATRGAEINLGLREQFERAQFAQQRADANPGDEKLKEDAGIAGEEFKSAIIAGSEQLKRNVRDAAEALKKAQDGYQSALQSAFKFLTPERKREALAAADRTIEEGVKAGDIDPRAAARARTPQQKFELADAARGVGSARDALEKAAVDHIKAAAELFKAGQFLQQGGANNANGQDQRGALGAGPPADPLQITSKIVNGQIVIGQESASQAGKPNSPLDDLSKSAAKASVNLGDLGKSVTGASSAFDASRVETKLPQTPAVGALQASPSPSVLGEQSSVNTLTEELRTLRTSITDNTGKLGELNSKDWRVDVSVPGGEAGGDVVGAVNSML